MPGWFLDECRIYYVYRRPTTIIRAQDMSNLLSAADRSAILELVAAYSFRWDAAEADEFSQLFTEDTECNFYLNGESDPSTELRGRDIMIEY
jgi:hypothetical protein